MITEAVVWRWSVKKGVLKNFAKFTGKHLCQSPSFLIKSQDLGLQLFLKRDYGAGVFFCEFLRTPSLMEQLWWLLL